MSGATTGGQGGTYGTKGTPSATNVPGARQQTVSWSDTSGNFWLFGGNGFDSVPAQGNINDLWKYTISTGQWTWMSGANTAGQKGTYGTQGTAAAANVPGARQLASSAIDSTGNLWLFGGLGVDGGGANGTLNDLWKYTPGTGLWTWISGSSTQGQAGTYGTKGTPAAANVPGARNAARMWADASGNLWVFGGFDTNALAFRNDLWKFTVGTGQWTWMSGANTTNQAGTYGTKGTAAAANVPGARENTVEWTDSSGNFFIFGGDGLDSNVFNGLLGDLWKYDVPTGFWTWVSGSNLSVGDGAGAPASYGTLRTAAASNVPGGRTHHIAWIDASGNLWLFGGNGVDSAGNQGNLNDLWKFSSGQWTWMSGANVRFQLGTFGTLGTFAAANVPGAKEYAISFIDSSGKLWLFGGSQFITPPGVPEFFNDLWRFQP